MATNSKQLYYKQLDGLRFFAAIAVVLHHINPLPEIFGIDLGALGVQLFFVISGFLITEILMREKQKQRSNKEILKVFFGRRVLRIFPLYYFYILLCYFIVPDQTSEYSSWLLTYNINFWITIHDHLAFWFFTHLWSLSVEEQFYLFWPFIVLLLSFKKLKNAFLIMIAFAIAYRIFNTFFIEGYNLFNITMLPTNLDCFGAGALLAYLKLFQPQLLSQILRHKYLILVGLILSSLNHHFGSVYSQQGLSKAFNASISFFIVGVSATAQFNFVVKFLLENRIVIYLGQVSYGIYVYHLLTWGTLSKYFKSFWSYIDENFFSLESLSQPFFMFVFISIATIMVSILSFELYEKQFLKLKKHFSYEPRPRNSIT